MIRWIFPAFIILASLSACASGASTTGASASIPDSTGVSPYRLDRVTLTTTNTETMVEFYQRVFEVRMKKLPMSGTYIYMGRLFGVEFTFVPYTATGVNVDRGRHEFNVLVTDLNAIVQRAVTTGGSIVKAPRIQGDEQTATVADPDGNTLVLAQRL